MADLESILIPWGEAGIVSMMTAGRPLQPEPDS
jgi:hypothetical protein